MYNKEEEDMAMTKKQIKQIESQLPVGEHIDRMYRAIEGDIRVITRDKRGHETRYTVRFDPDDNATIRQF